MSLSARGYSLDELRSFSDAEAAKPTTNASLLRVVLNNLLVALDHRHIAPEAVSAVFEAWSDAVREASAGRPRVLHVDRAYNLLGTVLAGAQKEWLFSRSSQLDTFGQNSAISFQPSWAFHWWFPDYVEPFARRPDLNEADLGIVIDYYSRQEVADLVAAFWANRERAPDKMVGQAGGVVFFTPEVGEVERHCRTAAEINGRSGSKGAALDEAAIADRLRNLLGLSSRHNGEQAVLVRLNGDIGDLQRAAEPPPGRSAESRAARRRPMAAPTQFEAVGHDRFRHWPYYPRAPAIDFGRTWDLDDRFNANGDCGAAEFVLSPQPVFKIELILPLGRIQAPNPSNEHKREADARFADAVCGSRTIADLIAAFQTRSLP